MTHPVRLLLVLILGITVGWVLCFFIPLHPADAQGVGFFGTSSTGTRTNCTAITSPVVGQTVCFDQAANTWKVYTGASQTAAQWVSGVASQTAVNNVKDFGAKGDGTTDDTTAITAAITAALGTTYPATVLFPPGNYVVTSTIAIPITATNLTLWGYGAQLQGKVNGDILSVGDLVTTNNHATYIAIVGLGINGDGSTTAVYPNQNGLGIYSVLGLTLRDVQVLNIPNIGIKAVKSAAAGSQFLNLVSLYNVAVRFTGQQGLSYCETGAACDDITITGSMFNNLGRLSTAGTRASGGVFIAAATSYIGFSEISAVQNANGTQGFPVALHLTNGQAFIAGLHLENNGANQVLSTDILLDTSTDGSVLQAVNCQEWQSTGTQVCLTIRSSQVQVRGLQQCSSGAHTITTVVDAGSAAAANFALSGLSTGSGCTAPTTWVLTAGGGTGTWTDQNGNLHVTGVGAEIGAPTVSAGKVAGTLNIASAILANGVPVYRFDGTPTCPNNCGQSAGSAPSIVGTNAALRVTLGAGTGSQAPATPFLVLFAGNAFATAPACNAQLASPGTSAATVTVVNASATGILINTLVNPPINAIYAVQCGGVG